MSSRFSSTTTTALLVALGLAVTACGSDDAGSGGSAGSPDAGNQDVQQSDVQKTDAEDETSPDALEQDVKPDMDLPDVQPDAESCTDVVSVTGSVIDGSDAPFVGIDAVVCITWASGKAVCLDPKKTDAAGEFSAAMPNGGECLTEIAYQIKHFGDLTQISQYCTVDLGAGGNIVTPAPVKILQAPEGSRDPLGDASQPHEIVSPDGVSMTVVPDELFLFDYTYEDMRLLSWDSSTLGWPCFIDPANAPDGLVAFAPEIELQSEDALHISFPNDASLAPGTAVDLYALGGAASLTWDSELIHEGHWQIIGEAEVTADGTRIETLAGEGLPFGTWVGWKQK